MTSMPSADSGDSESDVADRRYRAALDFLTSRINYERAPALPYGQRQLKLDRMRQMLTQLGRPDAGMTIVHVAGTKGKGSTSTLIARMLQAAGNRIGVFSSPHLEHLEERFSIDGQACSREDLWTTVESIRPVALAMDDQAARADSGLTGPTYFELTTAIALLYFARRKVDLAVLEVGLGGRLDSTNVCQPAVTVITSISFDHTKQLGNTLEQIAAEKAGIIKPGIPVVCGPMEDAPRGVVEQVAQAHGCRMIAAERDFSFRYEPPQQLDREVQCGRIWLDGIFDQSADAPNDFPLRLVGSHQAANAAVAVAAIEELRRQGLRVPIDAVQTGLAEATLPARVEIIRRRPTIVLDAAHNVASAQALVESLQTSFTCKDRVLLLSVSRDKDVRGILRALLPDFQHVIVTEYRDNPRAVPTEELGQLVRASWESETKQRGLLEEISMPLVAWRHALEQTQANQLLCVTGSFFIAAELRSAMLAEAKR